MLHPDRRQMIAMSILMDIDPTGKDNSHFQIAIDEWQKTYDKNSKKCAKRRNMISKSDFDSASNHHVSTRGDIRAGDIVNVKPSISVRDTDAKHITVSNKLSMMPDGNHDTLSQLMHNQYTRKDKRSSADNTDIVSYPNFTSWRGLSENTPTQNIGWDPFHESLEKVRLCSCHCYYRSM